jgi:hypothetical protein
MVAPKLLLSAIRRSEAAVCLCLLAFILFGCASLFSSGASAQVSDEQYIAIARDTPEVRAFYSKYPGVQPSVDRGGRLAVDFRAGPRLRVFIEKGRATDILLECPAGTIRTGDIISAIRQCG